MFGSVGEFYELWNEMSRTVDWLSSWVGKSGGSFVCAVWEWETWSQSSSCIFVNLMQYIHILLPCRPTNSSVMFEFQPCSPPTHYFRAGKKKTNWHMFQVLPRISVRLVMDLVGSESRLYRLYLHSWVSAVCPTVQVHKFLSACSVNMSMNVLAHLRRSLNSNSSYLVVPVGHTFLQLSMATLFVLHISYSNDTQSC